MKITSKKLAVLAGKLASDKKAINIKILDVSKLSSFTDYFVVCSAEVDVHMHSIAEYIIESLNQRGIRVWHNEGQRASRWILLDYVDVVIHIFLKEARSFYDLESLWADAPKQEIEEKMENASKRNKLK